MGEIVGFVQRFKDWLGITEQSQHTAMVDAAPGVSVSADSQTGRVIAALKEQAQELKRADELIKSNEMSGVNNAQPIGQGDIPDVKAGAGAQPASSHIKRSDTALRKLQSRYAKMKLRAKRRIGSLLAVNKKRVTVKWMVRPELSSKKVLSKNIRDSLVKLSSKERFKKKVRA